MFHKLLVIQRLYLKGGMSKFKAEVLKLKKKKKEKEKKAT